MSKGGSGFVQMLENEIWSYCMDYKLITTTNPKLLSTLFLSEVPLALSQILISSSSSFTAFLLMNFLHQDGKRSITAIISHDKVSQLQRTEDSHYGVKEARKAKIGGYLKVQETFARISSFSPSERMKELIEIIEGQADLDVQFNVEDADHIDPLISCLYMALPFVMRGASSSKFLNYLNKHILPVFEKLPEEQKLDLLKALVEISPYTTPQDSCEILPSVVQLLKKYMPRRKTGEEMNFTYVECLLYTFHHLVHKVPNATNSLRGYKIVTCQPSDRLGEDFSDHYKDFTERLFHHIPFSFSCISNEHVVIQSCQFDEFYWVLVDVLTSCIFGVLQVLGLSYQVTL
ncbi:hypothetical protein UlMin_041430 [Ulmus minor]